MSKVEWVNQENVWKKIDENTYSLLLLPYIPDFLYPDEKLTQEDNFVVTIIITKEATNKKYNLKYEISPQMEKLPNNRKMFLWLYLSSSLPIGLYFELNGSISQNISWSISSGEKKRPSKKLWQEIISGSASIIQLI